MKAILPRIAGFVLCVLLFGFGEEAAVAGDWPFPHANVTIENDTGVAVDGIEVNVYPAANFNPITENPPGCGQPEYQYVGYPYDPLIVTWPTACVDPGESVKFMFGVDCADCPTPYVYDHIWMLGGETVGGTATFRGYACVDTRCGESELGREVVAKINGVECGTATTALPVSDGEPVSWYWIEVPSALEQPGCGANGAIVEFYIDGVLAEQTGTWAPGEIHLDIWTGPDFMHLTGSLSCNGAGCFSCPDLLGYCDSGIDVSAYVGDELCGSTSPAGWLLTGTGYQDLSVDSDEATSGCGTPGATVRLEVDGHAAEETIEWQAGFLILPLTAPFPERSWADMDCDGDVTPRDAQGMLRVVLQQPQLSRTEPCPLVGTLFDAGMAGPTAWGDWDCDGEVTARDAQIVLRAVIGTLLTSMECAYPGDAVLAS